MYQVIYHFAPAEAEYRIPPAFMIPISAARVEAGLSREMASNTKAVFARAVPAIPARAAAASVIRPPQACGGQPVSEPRRATWCRYDSRPSRRPAGRPRRDRRRNMIRYPRAAPASNASRSMPGFAPLVWFGSPPPPASCAARVLAELALNRARLSGPQPGEAAISRYLISSPSSPPRGRTMVRRRAREIREAVACLPFGMITCIRPTFPGGRRAVPSRLILPHAFGERTQFTVHSGPPVFFGEFDNCLGSAHKAVDRAHATPLPGYSPWVERDWQHDE